LIKGDARQIRSLDLGATDAISGRAEAADGPSYDLCIAKLAAARMKDYRFVGALLEAGLVQLTIRADRARELPAERTRTRRSIERWIDAQNPMTRQRPGMEL
jgi:hypothetical protein